MNKSKHAFHGDIALKNRMLKRATRLRETGGFLNPRSQSIRNKVDLITWLSDNPDQMQALNEASDILGIPSEIIATATIAYERSIKDYQTIAEKLMNSCPVGADLTDCCNKVAIWILADGEYALLRHCSIKKSKTLLRQIAQLISEKCTDKTTWQHAEYECRAKAKELDVFLADYLADGSRAINDRVNPEFCALWGAARFAAWKGREVRSSYWVMLALSAWFKAEKELFFLETKCTNELPFREVQDSYKKVVQQTMAQELLNFLCTVLENA